MGFDVFVFVVLAISTGSHNFLITENTIGNIHCQRSTFVL